MTEKELKNMELDESMMVSQNLSIMRVPGGWIYINYSVQTSTFVPEPDTSKTWRKS